MILYITGISGFLGSRLARRWRERGDAVKGSSRRELVLGQPCKPAEFAGVDCLVHCAHDFSEGAMKRNVEGTQAVYEAARSAGVPRQVFVSSYSARPDGVSDYARTKHALEQFFLSAGEIVVRPGLVLGYGGLFGRNMDFLLKSPVIPLLNRGKDLVPIIAVRQLVEEMVNITDASRPGAYNLFERDLVPMGDLIRCLNRLARHRALYVPVTAAPASLFLDLAARVGVRLPVNAGNLRAVAANQGAIHSSDLQGRGLEAALKEALAERSEARRAEAVR